MPQTKILKAGVKVVVNWNKHDKINMFSFNYFSIQVLL